VHDVDDERERDLLSVDPAEFVAARDALRKQLREEGDRDAAERVAQLRKPPYTAWALNVIAGAQPELVHAAIDAGRALGDAMAPGSGAARDDLARVQHDERAATEALITAAAARIEGAGHHVTEAFRQRLQTTIRAAQLDPAVADRLVAGGLQTDEEVSVFGLAGEIALTARAPARPRRSTTTASKTSKTEATTTPTPAAPPTPPDREAAERRRAAVAHHHQLAREADRLEKRAVRLEEKSDELRRTADAAEADAGEARRAADDARQAAEAADPDQSG
jgi:hypothetical protein